MFVRHWQGVQETFIQLLMALQLNSTIHSFKCWYKLEFITFALKLAHRLYYQGNIHPEIIMENETEPHNSVVEKEEEEVSCLLMPAVVM